MKEFGFKNFRKFEDFPPIELGGINIFVGKNGSGKSSAIKAIIILLETMARKSNEYESTLGLMAPPITMVSFTSEKTSHLHLGNFESSLNHQAKNEKMSFSIKTGGTDINIDCCAKTNNVESLSLENDSAGISYLYKFDDSQAGGTVTCRFYITEEEAEKQWENDNKNIFQRFGSFFKNIFVDATTNDHKTKELSPEDIEKEQLRQNFIHGVVSKSPFQVTLPLSRISDHTSLSREESEDSEDKEFLRSFKYTIEKKNSILRQDLRQLNINYEYIEAHNASHKVLLDSEDKNNYVAQIVNRYYNLFKNEPNKLVYDWLKECEIGDSFRIEDVEGEAYKVYICNKDSQTLLGHEGTGTIQLFTLLLTIAIIIKTNNKCLVFVEEPEQNLHPSLQSKLADLFLYVHNETRGNVHFVVETHSEYIVRRLQVLAAERTFNNIPLEKTNEEICLYYFPKDDVPYRIEFMEDGRTSRDFGEGFTDESTNQYLQLLDIKERNEDD